MEISDKLFFGHSRDSEKKAGTLFAHSRDAEGASYIRKNLNVASSSAFLFCLWQYQHLFINGFFI